MDEDEAEAASAGICRSLRFHIADPPACYRRMNAQEVLSKHVADAEVSHATQSVLTAHNAHIVEGTTPSVGAKLMRAIEPSWPQSDTLIHMENFQSEAAAVDTFIASHTHGTRLAQCSRSESASTAALMGMVGRLHRIMCRRFRGRRLCC